MKPALMILGGGLLLFLLNKGIQHEKRKSHPKDERVSVSQANDYESNYERFLKPIK